jgi:hypothetical protein
MNQFCVYLTTYSGTLLPKFYVGSTSLESLGKGYKGSVASRLYSKIWKQEVKDHPELFSVEIISTHPTRLDALDAELEWQLERRVVEDENFVNMAYAKQKFYGLSTPALVEAFRQAIASRTPEEKAAVRAIYQERQRRVLAARSPEKVKLTAEKQSKSLALNHAQRSENDKMLTAERKRKTWESHDDAWRAEVNARRAESARKRWAKQKGQG